MAGSGKIVSVPETRPTSIRAKLLVAIAASMLALAVFTAALVRAAGERSVRLASEQAVVAAAKALAAAERAEVEKLDATARVLSAHPGLAEAFAARDRARLLSLAAPLFAALRAEHGMTHLYFVTPEPAPTCFLRVHQPDQFGDVIARATLAKAAETKQVASGKEVGRSAFALRVVRPWYGADGKLLGYLELGEEMDRFLDHLRAQTGDHYALAVDADAADRRTWTSARMAAAAERRGRARTVVLDATTPDESLFDLDRGLDAVPEGGLLLDEQAQDGRIVARGVVPVRDAAGRPFGALFVLHDVTALHDGMLEVRRNVYAALVAAAAGLGGLLLVLANQLVFRRLERMIGTMQELSTRLAAGDYDVVAPRPSGADEIGRFEEFFGRFLQAVAGLMKELKRDRTG
jgi:HAMP domain-containing protein